MPAGFSCYSRLIRIEVMRSLLLGILILTGASVWAQNSPPSSTPSSREAAAGADRASKAHTPDLTPPRSDRVSADSLEPGESSSKDSQIDLSPPPGDEKAHPESSEAVTDVESASGTNEFHPWDPHKAAKDVEVGDFYFKRKNYRAAEDRYREALFYKDNDALATYRLAICLEKLNRFSDALQEYQSYLRILPHGPEAEDAKKAIERLKDTAANSGSAK